MHDEEQLRSDSDLAPLEELRRQLDVLAPQVLCDVLAEAVVARRARDAAVEVVLEEEVDGLEVRQLEALDAVPGLVLAPEELLDLVDREPARARVRQSMK